MSIENLRQRVESEHARFVEVGKHVMADGNVSCEEAQKWLDWYKERKKVLALLKREANLEVRQLRDKHKVATLQAAKGNKSALRQELTLTIAPYNDALNKINKLLLEGDKLKPTLERLVKEEC